jgi:hypothetical protein
MPPRPPLHYPHYGNQAANLRNHPLRRLEADPLLRGRTRRIYNLADDIGEQTELRQQPEMPHNPRQDRMLADQTALPSENLTTIRNWPREQENTRTRFLQSLERQHAGFLAPDFQPNKDWWGSAAAPRTVD